MSSHKDRDFFYTTFKTPLGLMGLASIDGKLVRVKHGVKDEAVFKSFLEERYGSSPQKNAAAFKALIKQFKAFFSGNLKKFDWPLSFEEGTPFQKHVWKTLLKIPYGTTRSYLWLAKTAKAPSAYRAAGNANGRNPLPIIVPCHRVVRQNGALGGYTGGTEIKQFLLDLEQGKHGTL